MKLKLCLYTLCCCLIIGLAHAQIRRTTKMPDFFVPQGALSTTPKAEKLPPIEAMRFNGQQAPVVLEMQQKSRPQNTVSPSPQNEPRIYKRAKLHSAELPNTEPKPQPTEIITNQIPEPSEPEFINDEPELTTDEPELTTDEPVNEEPELTTGEPEIFDFNHIIADYKHDREAISKGHQLNNQRLNDMIADFQDLEHEI